MATVTGNAEKKSAAKKTTAKKSTAKRTAAKKKPQKTLLVVESPSKAKIISKYLGSKYKVMASVGHVRDLPKSRLGVDVDNNFEPEYINIRGKAETIKELKKRLRMQKTSFSLPTRTVKGKRYHGILHICSDLTRIQTAGSCSMRSIKIQFRKR